MAYGTANVDVIQSSTTGTPVQFNDGAGTQIGTLCRAWVNFNGTTGVRNGNFNVSSVTVNSTGFYTVNLTNAMPDTNYSIQVSNQQNASSNTSSNIAQTTSTSAISVYHFESGSLSYPNTNTPMFVAVFR